MDIDDSWKRYEAVQIANNAILKETLISEAAYYYGVSVCTKTFIALFKKHDCIDKIDAMEADIYEIIKTVEVYTAKSKKT